MEQAIPPRDGYEAIIQYSGSRSRADETNLLSVIANFEQAYPQLDPEEKREASDFYARFVRTDRSSFDLVDQKLEVFGKDERLEFGYKLTVQTLVQTALETAFKLGFQQRHEILLDKELSNPNDDKVGVLSNFEGVSEWIIKSLGKVRDNDLNEKILEISGRILGIRLLALGVIRTLKKNETILDSNNLKHLLDFLINRGDENPIKIAGFTKGNSGLRAEDSFRVTSSMPSAFSYRDVVRPVDREEIERLRKGL